MVVAGSGGFSTSGNVVSSAGYLSASTSVKSRSNFWLYGDYDNGWANAGDLDGNVNNLMTADDSPIVIGSNHASRDTPNAYITAVIYDRGEATFTNESTVKLMSWGWTNDSDFYNEKAYVRGDGAFVADSTIQSALKLSVANVINIDFTDVGVTGTCETIGSLTLARALCLRSIRTDAPDNIAIASTIDNNTASITNADTMRIHSFGWTDNTNTYNEVAYVRADGAFALTADSYSATIEGQEADGASAIGVIIDTAETYSTSGAKLFSVQNNADEKAYIQYDGTFVLTDTSSATIEGQEADGATAVGVAINTAETYSTSGAKLLSVQNNSSEKAYVTKDGDVAFDAQLHFATAYTVATAPNLL
jgi:hypothetical protein